MSGFSGIITVKYGGTRWRVHQALNASKAWDAITHALCSGTRRMVHQTAELDGSLNHRNVRVDADVERIR
jgi:hypothetical protein